MYPFCGVVGRASLMGVQKRRLLASKATQGLSTLVSQQRAALRCRQKLDHMLTDRADLVAALPVNEYKAKHYEWCWMTRRGRS